MKKILTVLMVLIATLCTAFAFGACDLFGTGDNGTDTSAGNENSSENNSGNGSNSNDSNTGNGSNSNNTGNGNTSNGGNTSGGNSHTCVFVFTKRVDGCETNGYDLYTCKDPTCGKTEQHNSYAPVGHDYKHETYEATCTTYAGEADVCTKCGHIKNRRTYEGTKKEHAYVWTETTPASCTVDGSKEGVCPDCGAKKTESITANGHSYGDYKSNNDATCTSFETETAVCSVCKHEDTRSIPNTRLDHNYGSSYVTVVATCAKDAINVWTCNDCGDKRIKTVPDSKLPHEYGNWTTIVGDCQTENVHKRTCKNCDYEDSYTDGYGNHKMEPKSSYGQVTGDTCELCGAGLQKTTGKFYLDVTTKDTETSTGDGNLGAVYLEFTILSVNGSIITYNMDLIQEYTLDGEDKVVRQNVAVAYDGKNAGYFNNDFTLWSLSDECELTGGGWMDYSVYKPVAGSSSGWIQVILQFSFYNGVKNVSYGHFAHVFYLAY